jgi:hypothetical protein
MGFGKKYGWEIGFRKKVGWKIRSRHPLKNN